MNLPKEHQPTDAAASASAPNRIASAVGFRMKLSLSCDLADVRPACLSAVEFLAVQHVHPDHLAACELALVEACNNAILYAEGKNRELPVEIELLSQAPRLEMHVIDHTRGFDWPKELHLPDNDSEHGRGLFIIQSLMDDAVYLRGEAENRLIMRKEISLKKSEEQAAEARPDSPLPAQDPRARLEAEQKLALSEKVLNSMAQELCIQVINARTAKEQMDGKILARELEIARNIQQSLLPRAFPSLPGFGLAGFCLSARQVGGDFFDVLPLSARSALLVVADVMGKGVPAALFAATLRTLLRTAAHWTRRPSELLRQINHHMFDELSGVDMFITAQLALIDLSEQTLTVANAGHCPLLLTNNEGETTQVSPDGMPLGIVPETEFADQVLGLEKAHSVLLYTDGLTEARNPEGEWFGRERLIEWLRNATNASLNAKELSDDFLKELGRFQSSATIKDDQTFLILRSEKSTSATTRPMHLAGMAPALF